MKNNWKFINLQNLGPIWKLLCCVCMGVDVPSSAAIKILNEQEVWERQRKKCAEKSHLHKRYKIYCKCNHLLMYFISDSNIRKRAKSTRHEKEKAYIEQLRSAGATVGQYVGNGLGETETECLNSEVSEEKCDDNIEAAEMDDGDQHDVNNVIEDSSGDAYPLLFFYDCETTGFSVYNEHITEIAAKVVGVPLSSFSQPTFSSLVKTSRNISKKGTN